MQQDVERSAVERRDIAALSGRVQGEDGAPLSGVVVEVLGHPELGFTESRGDGAFDLAVPPGTTTLRFSSADVIPAQRTVLARRGSYAASEVVELLRQVPSTPLDVREGGVVRSEMSADADGERAATILFPAGMEARVRQADGSMVEASMLRVRPREFTVGERGPERMVSTLPGASGYTYAIELGVEEGEDVEFDRPVPIYIDNFLDMPVGTPVPVGSYDRSLGRWVPEADGRIVEVVSTEGGVAALDIDGDGVADDTDVLRSELGATDEELRSLASAHSAGDQLWRFAPNHFSAWDCNWPFAFPPDAIAPALEGLIAGAVGADAFIQDSCAPGSDIRVQRQILGENVPLVGTGMALHYSSDRHPAYSLTRRIEQVITPGAIPPSLREVRVELSVAGQEIRERFDPAPNLTYTHDWNGLDRFGRLFRGPAPFVLRVGYVYDGDYTVGADDRSGPGFGRGGDVRVTGSRTREEIVAWEEVTGLVRLEDERATGLLGFSLSAHHRYDPLSETLHLGTGGTLFGAATPRIIERIAGGELGASDGAEGMPADGVDFEDIQGVAADASGRVYFAESRNHRIWRIEEDGTVTRIAGTGTAGTTGDGGPARDAQIDSPVHLAFGPGGLYFTSETRTTRVIRRIDDAGVIHRVAGTGDEGDAIDGEGDGLLAAEVALENPQDLAVGADGTVYFIDGLSTLRMVDGGGRVQTLNPRATRSSAEDGTPLSRADIGVITSIALRDDGTLFLAASQQVYRVGPERLLQRVAGGGEAVFGEGGVGDIAPALSVDLGTIQDLATGLDGELYILDSGNGRRLLELTGSALRRVTGDRGAPTLGNFGNGGPAAAAPLGVAAHIAVRSSGAGLASEAIISQGNPRSQLRRVAQAFGIRGGDGWVVPSPDGTLRYIFDIDGRHLRTETALTGALVHRFDYEDELLASIADGQGNTLRIERGPELVLRPFEGPPTRLIDEDGDGYADVIRADGDVHEDTFDWREGGQLALYTDRLDVMHAYEYDARGRLTSDGVVGGAAQRLERDEEGNVTLTTGGGRPATWGATMVAPGAVETRAQAYSDASGVTVTRTTNEEGIQTTRYEDGSEEQVTLRPDIVLGAGVSVPVSTTIRTPSGREATWTLEQEAVLDGTELQERTTRITTNVDTRREATTTERLTLSADGSVFEVVSAEGRRGEMVRDAAGQLVSITQPGRFPVTLEYDEHGRLERASQGPEGAPDLARTLTWTLPALPSDSFGDVRVEDASGSLDASFDSRGRNRQLQDDPGITSFAFDEASRSFEVIPPG
ncbi:MAG: hypothetical protein AAF645_17495, partial [Myxococcota bacterium]